MENASRQSQGNGLMITIFNDITGSFIGGGLSQIEAREPRLPRCTIHLLLLSLFGSSCFIFLTLIFVIRQFSTLYDLRSYRLFAHIAAALGGFMFAKRANRGSMRKSTTFNGANCCYKLPFFTVLLLSLLLVLSVRCCFGYLRHAIYIAWCVPTFKLFNL